MPKELWRVTYDITMVNGNKYPKEKELVEYAEEQLPRTLKTGAERLADQYDFAIVYVKAESLNDTTKVYEYTHRSESGQISDWRVSS